MIKKKDGEASALFACDPMKFGENLRHVRKALDINQEDMAQKIGVHHQTFSRYERGEILPGIEILYRLVFLLSVNPLFLLSGKGDMFMEAISEERYSPDLVKMSDSKGYMRRFDDKDYRDVSALREGGPEAIRGLPILRLKFLRTAFADLDHDHLRYVVHTESNFMPSVPPGNILMVDLNAEGITSSFYILRYDDNSIALRRLEPVDSETCKVVFAHINGFESSKEMPMETIRKQIVGRVVWIARKV